MTQRSRRMVRSVNPEAVKRLFDPDHDSQFRTYFQNRIAMQWGGLADQFDEYERQYGVSLELLEFFRSIEYPITMSTKAAWWAHDPRYQAAMRGADHFNVKFSIITLDQQKARRVELGAPTPMERLEAMAQIAKLGVQGVTLRLRPYIIGVSDASAVELIRLAAEHGATAVSTEMFCLEMRSKGVGRYSVISDMAGFDIVEFYRKASGGAGYLRLNRNVKRPYFQAVKAAW